MDREKYFGTILIQLRGQYRDISLALLSSLKEKYASKIILICKTREDAGFYKTCGIAAEIYPLSQVETAPESRTPDEIFRRARAIEEKYGTNIHYHMIDRRAYFTGSSRFPYFGGKEAYPRWLAAQCRQFDFFEELFDRYDFTLTIYGNRVIDEIAGHRKVPRRNLYTCLYGNRHLWYDCFSRDGAIVRESFQKEAPDGITASGQNPLAPPPSHTAVRSNVLKGFRWDRLLMSSFRNFARGVYYKVKGYDKADVYGFSGTAWSRYLWRQRSEFKRIKKLATVRWQDLKGVPYVFYPMASEPETTLSVCSPEYFDQMSIIQSVAKELPAGYYLAVKEHVIAIGSRPRDFYEIICRMPNVLFVDVEERGIDIVSTARAVATIASAAGFEAAVNGIPVLSFGSHNFFEFLEHVKVVRSWQHLRPLLRESLSYGEKQKRHFELDGLRLLKTLDTIGIDLSRICDSTFKNVKPGAGNFLLESLQRTLSKEYASHDGRMRADAGL